MDAGTVENQDAATLSAALAASFDGMAVIDRKGRLLETNQALARAHGYQDAAALEQTTLWDLCEESHRKPLQDEVLAKAWDTGWRGQLATVGRDGSIAQHAARLQPIDAERALLVLHLEREPSDPSGTGHADRSRLDLLLNEAPVIVFELAPDGTFTLSRGKPLEHLGLEPGEVVGRTVFDLYAGHEEVLDDARRALGGERFSITREVEDRVFETRWTPITDADGAVQRVIGVATDVTERARAEDELRLARDRFHALFAASNDPIVLHDLDGWIEDANQRTGQLLGCDTQDLVGKHIADLQPEDEIERGQEALEQVLSEGSAHFETAFETADGERIPVEVSARRMRTGDREIVQGIARDIRERKRTEANLRMLIEEREASQAELHSLVNALPDLVLVLDADGRYVEEPRGNLDLLHVEPDGIVGQALGQTLPAGIADRLTNAVEQCRLEDDLVRVEFSLPINDEATFLEGRFVPMPGQRVLLLARDITELKRAEEEIKAAQEQFELAVGDLSQALGSAESTQEVARRLSHGAQALTGAKATAVIAPDALLASGCDPQLTPDDVREMVRAHPERFEWFSASLDASERPIDLLVLPREADELDEGDRHKLEIVATQAAIAFHRAEVTDRIRRAHDRLERSARQKQMFLDVLSHDLKNPLAVATGRVDLLGMRHPELKKELAPLDQALERATSLIERSLLYSRLEEQRDLARTRENLHTLVDDVRANLSTAARDAGVTVTIEGPDALEAPAHPILSQALENLLGNAIKWSPRGSQVQIELETGEDVRRIRVVDRGPGIDPEDRDQLFERFTRVDRSGTKGTGLGLAIANRIVDMHEGRLWHEPTPGGGATFVVELPAQPPN